MFQTTRSLGNTLLAVGALLLSACGSASAPTDASEPADLPIVNGIPQFEGPWAGALTQQYQEENNEYFRMALANGHISEREIHEAKSRAEQCMTDQGLTGFVLNDDGSAIGGESPTLSEEEEREAFFTCEVSSGWAAISSLGQLMKANPANKDWNAAELQCMIDQGYLQPGATQEDYQHWEESQPVEVRFEKEAVTCRFDPFGELGMAEELAAQSGPLIEK